MTAVPVARCGEGCDWRGCDNHDEMVTLQEDGHVLGWILAQMVMWGDNDLAGKVGLFEIGDFVRAHNWPDPVNARWLADNLEEIFRALHPKAAGDT